MSSDLMVQSNNGLMVQNNAIVQGSEVSLLDGLEDDSPNQWPQWVGFPMHVVVNCQADGAFLIKGTNFRQSSIDIIILQSMSCIGEFYKEPPQEWTQVVFIEVDSGAVCEMMLKTKSHTQFKYFVNSFIPACKLQRKQYEDFIIRCTITSTDSKNNDPQTGKPYKYSFVDFKLLKESMQGDKVREFKKKLKEKGIVKLVKWPEQYQHEDEDTQDTADPVIIGTGEHSVKVTGDPMSPDNLIIRIDAMLKELNIYDVRNKAGGETGWKNYNYDDLLAYFYQLDRRVKAIRDAIKQGNNQPQAPSFFG